MDTRQSRSIAHCGPWIPQRCLLALRLTMGKSIGTFGSMHRSPRVWLYTSALESKAHETLCVSLATGTWDYFVCFTSTTENLHSQSPRKMR
ncbi:hypothetical protein K431DRAFT_284422 [Polychaeton citri CBS 116435]|uniref:Uncharacterized protein n=1 Tax=Polychaeton citri CBS 116435 TaxID=1314669 RepID=A0A9P4Q7D5_9PEZI|nr:hypothetical protein K431DRAFT_284422 [Polychaeton citri CBS 116435]